MKEITKFIRWANSARKWRGLICHFYIAKSMKQYYSTTDYAYFNLLSGSKKWVVKGTPHHGILSQRGKRSPVPCLNCFEIDDEFYKGLKTLCDEGNEKFELGVIFNKRKLRNWFGKRKIIDVSEEPPSPLPPPRECHHYDWVRKRRGALHPFHYCYVVRVEIPRSKFHNLAIEGIPSFIIMGMLVKQSNHADIHDLLESKGLDKTRVFPLL